MPTRLPRLAQQRRPPQTSYHHPLVAFRIRITLVSGGSQDLRIPLERNENQTLLLLERIRRHRLFLAPLHLPEAGYRNLCIHLVLRCDQKKIVVGLRRLRNNAAVLRLGRRREVMPLPKEKVLRLTTENTMGANPNVGLRPRKLYSPKH